MVSRRRSPLSPAWKAREPSSRRGPGIVPTLWRGRRVACVADSDRDGPWAQYMITSARSCFPVGGDVPDEQAATSFVNPLTAIALLERARELGADAVVSTAAASQVGRMLLRLGKQRGVPVIHIVRRQEQVDLLRDMGGEHILDSSAPDFDEQLHALTRQLDASVLFDAVAGPLTGRVLAQMPSGSTAVVYGALSVAASEINPGDLIFKNKRIEGFWLAAPHKSLNALSLVRTLAAGRRVLGGDEHTRTDIRGTYTLTEAINGIEEYAAKMSDGKVLITPNG